MGFKESLTQLKQPVKISQYLSSENIRRTIANTLGESQVQQFVSDVITMCHKNEGLLKCDPLTVVMGALHGTGLRLNSELGEYWLVPYEDRRTGSTKAQFQIGKAGMTQLALRSDLIGKIQTSTIKEGEVIKIDPIQGEYEFKPLDNRDRLPTIGYYAYFVLTNGAKNESYWTKEKVIAHATEYSQAFRSKTGSSPWVKHFDTMAENVVLYHLLKRSAPKSRDFSKAQRTNQAVIYDPQGVEVEYIDNPHSQTPKQKVDWKSKPTEDTSNIIQKAIREHGTQKVHQDLLSSKEETYTQEDFENLEYVPSYKELEDGVIDEE